MPRRRVVAASVAAGGLAVASAALTGGTTAEAILHPMPPLGNIDCCH